MRASRLGHVAQRLKSNTCDRSCYTWDGRQAIRDRAAMSPELRDKIGNVNCPGCAAEMTALTLAGHSGAAMTVDLCPSCHALWLRKRS